jgi:MYXO-CTERM domain-containing protein
MRESLCRRTLGAIVALAFINGNVTAVTMDTVFVGDQGNAPDQDYGEGAFGAVPYAYRIGVFEVTNDQYVEFLNAKATTDALGLFNIQMEIDPLGGITQGGLSGSYHYAVKENMGNKPVNYVSWYDAVRFANWLNNGQANANTESGAYTLLGSLPIPSNGPSVTRSSAARWFLPSENEWYKAAYYDPRESAVGGPAFDRHYWLFPTQSDSEPTIAAANEAGDISNPGANVANYMQGANWNGQLYGNVTSVGSAGPLSSSFYGTFDQGGNLWEWNDEPFFGIGPKRYARGGSGATSAQFLSSTPRVFDFAARESNDVGFRVAASLSPADFDVNGRVDAADLATWGAHFGLAGDALKSNGDANADGDVDGQDFLGWQEDFSDSASLVPSVSVVPEPSSAWLPALIAGALLPLRRRPETDEA